MLYQDIPLPGVPVSTHITRQLPDMSNKAVFLEARLKDYTKYLTELLGNLTTRFECNTFAVCVSIGKLLDFDNIVSPTTNDLLLTMNPMLIENRDDLS